MTKTGLLETLIKEDACPLQLSLHLLNMFLLSKRSFLYFISKIFIQNKYSVQKFFNLL